MPARRLRVPGDKSISHRALMLAALGNGESRIRGLLRSADIESTASVLRTLTMPVPALDLEEIVIDGAELRGLRELVALVGQEPMMPLDCGNSGTTARLMSGVIAASGIEAVMHGDASLSARPMQRIAAPLRAMGVEVTLPPHGGLPMTIHGGPRLRGLNWIPEVASAQVKSAILLAGLVGDVPVEILEPIPTRDHTERMLRARGVDVRSDGDVVSLDPRGRLDALDVVIPGDPSSAAFIAGFAALGGALRDGVAIEGVGTNPRRVGAFRALQRFGASVRYEDIREEGGEPMATILVVPGSLQGISIEELEVPALIDELPLLACVAARAEGETRVTGAAELRVKESDRIRLVVENLRAIGAVAEELPDGFVVHGSDHPLKGRVTTGGDHRIAMAFGILAALPGNEITIDDPSCVAVSYPTFWDDLARFR